MPGNPGPKFFLHIFIAAKLVFSSSVDVAFRVVVVFRIEENYLPGAYFCCLLGPRDFWKK